MEELIRVSREEWKQWLDSRAPSSFGQHPDFERNFKECRARAYTHFEEGQFDKTIFGEEISLSSLADSRHPEVFVIPRDRYLFIVDEWDDAIGFERVIFPFSSTDFYVDTEREGIFQELLKSDAFFRLGKIEQLGYLVPPRPEEWDKEIKVSYTAPQFHHTRWCHSLLTAILMELVLARNGFSKIERAPMVLAAGCHDIATPAGGDSVKRVDPEALGEVKNFAWVLKHHGLAERWSNQFGFDLSLATDWVKSKGAIGKLLNALDKISYVALDCYYLGLQREGQIRDLCIRHPLIMDLWQDIRFTPHRTSFGFSEPERLFQFLLLKAYEYQEFLFNPYSRALDLFLKKMTQPLYEKGVITKKQLLTQGNDWLLQVLSEHYPQQIKWYIEPEELSWRKFSTPEKQQEFCSQMGDRIDHLERITGFPTGLDWPVFHRQRKRIVSLRQAISQKKIELLEEIVTSVQGYYVYFRS